MWVQAELVAIATDLAEVIGGAIALNLLFGIPLFTGGVITGMVAFALLALQSRGYRPFELAIAGLLGVILLGFVTTVLRIDLVAGRPGRGPGPALRRHRQPAAGHRHPRRHRDAARDLPALGADPEPDLGRARWPSAATCSATSRSTCWSGWGWPAWSTPSMLIIAAALFFGTDVPDTDTLEGVHAGLARVLDQPAAFAVRAGPAGLRVRVLRASAPTPGRS